MSHVNVQVRAVKNPRLYIFVSISGDVTYAYCNVCIYILFFAYCLLSACACHVPGVNSSADSSQCDGVSGQCACKSHVTGRACDTCRDDYWKLSISNEEGCEG